MRVEFAFIIDPISTLDPGHDTSIALMEAAQQSGHIVWVTQAHQLSVVDGKTYAWLQHVELAPIELIEGQWITSQSWFQLGEPVFMPLETGPFEGIGRFTLWDLSGKICLQREVESWADAFLSFELPALQQGMYFYRWQGGNALYSGKLLIQRPY